MFGYLAALEDYFELWYVKSILIMLMAVGGFISFNFTLALVQKNLGKNKPWFKIILVALRAPGLMLIIGLGSIEVLHIALEVMKYKKITIITNLQTGLLVSILTWFCFRAIDEAEQYLLRIGHLYERKVDETAISAMGNIVKIAIGAIAALVFMDLLGISTQGLVAFGGASGIVMGLASKDVLANIMGALTIYLDQPFKIGDWIKIMEKDIEGDIQSIGIRCTVMQTFDKRPLYVPNAIFAQAVIENISRMSHRRIDVMLRVSHQDLPKIESLTQAINNILESHVHVDKSQIYKVAFDGSDLVGLNVRIYCFTTQIELGDFLSVKQDILLKVHHAGSVLGCHIAHGLVK
jgi:MscS family membrane protein